jgi:hypothetical protein
MSRDSFIQRFPVAVTLAATIAGTALTACVTRTHLEGARTPPDAWVASSNACDQIAGTYAEVGAAAPANSRAWIYMVVWPNFGSLVSFVEHGANGTPGFPPLSIVRIDVDASGHATFRAFDTAGGEQPVKAREWWCEGGMLVTRGPLNLTRYTPENHEESLVRLWKAPDGALIAEDTFREVRHHLRDSQASHTAFARFYFRFPARAAAAGT